jgi:multidrug efflux system membrane fusion protein
MSEASSPPVSGRPASEPPSDFNDQNSAGRSSFPYLWIALLLLLVIGVAWYLHHRGKAAASVTGAKSGGRGVGPTMVSTVTAQQGDMGVYLKALGTVTPVYTVSVAARVAGQINTVSYQEGQHVRIGDPLVDIDPRPYQAAVTQAQGQLEHDQALLADAKINLARYQEAFSSNAIPQQQYATQAATVQADQGTVDVDQGNLDNAKLNLLYCHITSPIDGRVGLRLVDPGNLVQANGTTPLVIITQTQPITVIFNVAEDDLPTIIAALQRDQSLTMDVYDREDQTKIATGKLEVLDNQINTSTGTLRLRGVCSNEDESLFPNQFVNVHLLVNTLRGITLLPNSVIQRNSDAAFVYLIKPPDEDQTNQTVQLQTITVGETDGTNSQVDGVSLGASVAADNFNRLNDGATVTLRPAYGQEPGHRKSHQQTPQ